ncbi:hypothetical protein N9T79_00150 [Candidatus Pelagibacter sp.]|nr:hypothetical protein [Candidatus Pelagibacter sp.]
MKNKDFNLIEYLASKNIFITKANIKDKNFKMVQAAHGSSTQKTLKNSFNTLKNKSRNETLHHRLGARILFVDFKNKTINKKRGSKNV